MSYFAITLLPKSIQLNSKRINLLYRVLLFKLMVKYILSICRRDTQGWPNLLFCFLSESEHESELKAAFLIITICVLLLLLLFSVMFLGGQVTRTQTQTWLFWKPRPSARPGIMDVKDRRHRSLTRGRCGKECRYTSSSLDSEDCRVPTQKSYSSSETLKAYDHDSRMHYGNRVTDLVHRESDEFPRQGM